MLQSLLFFEYFSTFCHWKMLQSHLVFPPLVPKISCFSKGFGSFYWGVLFRNHDLNVGCFIFYLLGFSMCVSLISPKLFQQICQLPFNFIYKSSNNPGSCQFRFLLDTSLPESPILSLPLTLMPGLLHWSLPGISSPVQPELLFVIKL